MAQRFPTWTWPSNPWQPHTARRFFEQLSLDIQSVHALLSWNRDFCLGHAILILDSRIQLEDSSSNSSSTVKVFTRLFSQTRATCPLTYIAAAKCSFSKFEFRPCVATASTQKTSVCHRLVWRQRILTSTLSWSVTLSTWSGKKRRILGNFIHYPARKVSRFYSKKYDTVTIIASFRELGTSASLFPPLIQVVTRVDGKPSCCQCIGLKTCNILHRITCYPVFV